MWGHDYVGPSLYIFDLPFFLVAPPVERRFFLRVCWRLRAKCQAAERRPDGIAAAAIGRTAPMYSTIGRTAPMYSTIGCCPRFGVPWHRRQALSASCRRHAPSSLHRAALGPSSRRARRARSARSRARGGATIHSSLHNTAIAYTVVADVGLP